jgi:hypothetical protein
VRKKIHVGEKENIRGWEGKYYTWVREKMHVVEKENIQSPRHHLPEDTS